MRLKSLTSIAALLVFAQLVSAADRIERLQWPVGDAPIVKLESFKGLIRVEPAQSGVVELELTARASGNDAQRWLDKLTVKGSAFGAGLVISVKQAGWGVEFGTGPMPDRTLDLVLRVPQRCTLDLKSDSGRIEVASDIFGSMRARLASGDIYFGRVIGSVNAETTVGSVVISHATGDVTARSHRGDLQVGTVMGKAQLRADHGNIEVVNSFGGLTAEAVKGNVKAGMSRRVSADTRLQAKAGDVIVDVDPDTALVVQAQASWGRVNSALELDVTNGQSSKSRLQGALNGGGALLALRASGGNVHIKSVPTYGM